MRLALPAAIVVGTEATPVTLATPPRPQLLRRLRRHHHHHHRQRHSLGWGTWHRCRRLAHHRRVHAWCGGHWARWRDAGWVAPASPSATAPATWRAPPLRCEGAATEHPGRSHPRRPRTGWWHRVCGRRHRCGGPVCATATVRETASPPQGRAWPGNAWGTRVVVSGAQTKAVCLDRWARSLTGKSWRPPQQPLVPRLVDGLVELQRW